MVVRIYLKFLCNKISFLIHYFIMLTGGSSIRYMSHTKNYIVYLISRLIVDKYKWKVCRPNAVLLKLLTYFGEAF